MTLSERYERPPWVRRLNLMGPAVGAPADVVPIAADELLASAVRSTGLSDFDVGDGDWEPRFRRLVDAINRAPLHVVGRLMTRQELLRGLRTRLRMAEAAGNDPGLVDEVIQAPVVITGPSRSGTTILFELIGLDPALRTPDPALMLHPVVDPEGPPAIELVECEQELWADIQPEFDAMHELRRHLPIECITFASPSFAGSHWSFCLQDNVDWAPEPEADFAFHRRMLQTVQRLHPLGVEGHRPRWVLKTPAHVMVLDQLLATYPDARIIQTHRDPNRTMPSTVSITSMVQWMRATEVDTATLGALVVAFFGGALNDVATRRASGDLPDVFGDVHFVELMADPVDAISRAYSSIGRSLSAEHAAAITDYLVAKPKGKHGTHRYSAEEWGFDPAQLRADFGPYMEHFGVAIEEA